MNQFNRTATAISRLFTRRNLHMHLLSDKTWGSVQHLEQDWLARNRVCFIGVHLCKDGAEHWLVLLQILCHCTLLRLSGPIGLHVLLKLPHGVPRLTECEAVRLPFDAGLGQTASL